MKHIALFFAATLTMLLLNGLVFAQDTTLTITSNGNVGIGTTNPLYPLHVVSSTLGLMQLESSNSTATRLWLRNTSIANPYALVATGTTSNIGGGKFFIGQNYAPSLLPRLTIDSSGNVGIGTTNPAYKLDVSDTVNAAAFRGDGSQLTNLPAVSSQWTSSGSTIYYNTGNVGIGTTSPTELLQLGSFSATDRYLILKSAGGNLYRNGIKFRHFNETIGFTIENDERGGSLGLNILRHHNDSAGVTSLFIGKPNGNVGIGTTSPAQLLHLTSGSTGGTQVVIDNTDIGGRDFRLLSTGTGNAPGAGRLALFDNTGGGYRVVLDSSGNVGIGTTSPSVKLSLGTDVTAQKLALFDGPGDFYGLGIEPARMVFHTSNTEKMTILNTGNVGIGTTSPTDKVQLNDFSQAGPVYLKLATSGVNIPPVGPKFAGIKLRHFDNNHGFTLESRDDNGPDGFRIKSHLNDSTGFIRLFINRINGNIGIGTTAPDELLSVNGNASKVGGGSWATFSDRRVKQDINTFSDGLSVIKGIRPVTFRYNGKLGYPTDKTYVGVIAQEVQSVAPYTVDTYRAKLNPDDAEETDILRFDGTALTYIAINAIKELNAKVEEMRELQKENQNLSSRLAELEVLVKSLAAERKSIDGKSLGELR